MQTNTIPIFDPKHLSPADSARFERQKLRWYLLMQDYGDVDGESNIRPAIDSLVGPERAGLIPSVDFSNNPLLTAALQLSTPGLYNGPPKVFHADPRGQELATIMEQAEYWLDMQFQQFVVAGMGDGILHVGLENGAPVFRSMPTFMVVPALAPHDPECLIGLRELRCRDLSGLDPVLGIRWCWDVYDLSDPKNPQFYIEQAGSKARYTNILPNTPAEGLAGDKYRWRYSNGTPFIPYAHYAVQKTGTWWHENSLRGLTRSTLSQMAFGTMANQSAMDSSHATAIGVDVELPGAPTTVADGAPPASRMAILPGSFLALQSREGSTNVSIHQLRPSADLAQLRLWMASQESAVLSRLGLSSDDVQFMAANPTSAASLTIRNKAKQQMAARFEPYFRSSDLEVFRMVGAMLGYPEEGYSITYRQIPLSPEERKAELEADEVALRLDLVSPVDLYQKHNPGTTREDAFTALAQVKSDKAQLSALSTPPSTPTSTPTST